MCMYMCDMCMSVYDVWCVCMYVCIYVYVCACVWYVCVYVCHVCVLHVEARARCQGSSILLLLLFQLRFPIWLGYLASQHSGSASPYWGYRHMQPCLEFLWVLGHFRSVPQACIANTLIFWPIPPAPTFYKSSYHHGFAMFWHFTFYLQIIYCFVLYLLTQVDFLSK